MRLIEYNIFYPELNLPSRERLDPLLALLLDGAKLADQQHLYVFGELLLLGCGMLLLTALFSSDRQKQLFAGCSAVSALVFLFGFDPFLLKLQWFPWMLAGMIHLAAMRRMSALAVAAVPTAAWLLSSGALGPFGVLLAGGIALLTSPGRIPIQEYVLNSGNQSLLLLVVMVAFFVGSYFLPQYPMPSYPPNARLVPGEVFSSFPRPMLGPHLQPMPMLEQAYWKQSFGYLERWVLVTVLLGAVLGLCRLRQVGFLPSVLSWAAVVCVTGGLLVGGQLFLPTALLPFFQLVALIPGLALVATPWPLLGLLLLPLIAVLCGRSDRTCGGMVCVVLFALAAVFQFAELGRAAPQHFNAFSDQSTSMQPAEIAWSPSAPAVAAFGAWITDQGIAKQRDFSVLERLLQKRDFEVQLAAVPNSEAAPLAMDGNVFTRWRTARAQQPGDFFVISFDRPVAVVRVVLSVKDNNTDFPRGIRVSGKAGDSDWFVLVNLPSWPGPVKWSIDGFPYFGPREQVILDFPKQQEVTQLRFEQLAEGNAFDWSINEVKLYANGTAP